MTPILKPFIEQAIEEDIICIQQISQRIFEKIFLCSGLKTEILMFMDFIYYLKNRVDYSGKDMDHLHLKLSIAKKLKAQTNILHSKLQFSEINENTVNKLFAKFKVYLKSILSHLSQLELEEINHMSSLSLAATAAEQDEKHLCRSLIEKLKSVHLKLFSILLKK